MSGHGYGIGEAGHPLGEWDDDEVGGCPKRTAVDVLRASVEVPPSRTCRREGCTNTVHPSNVVRYSGCCSSACFDAYEDAQEIAALKARVAELEAEIERLREELRVMAARLREVRDTALLRQGQIERLREKLARAEKEWPRDAIAAHRDLARERDAYKSRAERNERSIERLLRQAKAAIRGCDEYRDEAHLLTKERDEAVAEAEKYKKAHRASDRAADRYYQWAIELRELLLGSLPWLDKVPCEYDGIASCAPCAHAAAIRALLDKEER